MFAWTRMTSSARPSGDHPPATYQLGPVTRARSVAVSTSSITMSMSVGWRAFDENATRVPSGEVAFHERSRCTRSPSLHDSFSTRSSLRATYS